MTMEVIIFSNQRISVGKKEAMKNTYKTTTRRKQEQMKKEHCGCATVKNNKANE